MSERPRAAQRWGPALAAGLIVAVTFAAYYPSLHNGFTNWDDPSYVTDNAAIRSLSWHAIRHMFSSYILMYHPLTILSLAVDYRLFGLDPQGYHAVNLALHLANTLLVLAVLRLLSGSLAAAAAGSLLFGVHPLHVESVAWIAERKDVLSAFFFLGALGAYLRYLGGVRPRAWYLLALCLLTFSLLAKPMGVTFPLVACLCDYLRGRKVDRRALLEKLPFFLPALLVSAVTLIATGLFGSGEPTVIITADNFFVATHSLIFYLAKAVAPFDLSALYPFPVRTAGLLPWRFLLSPVPAALVCLAVLRSARVTRVVPFGFLFFAVTLLPTLAMRIGPHFAADRYFYLPSLGLCYLCGVGFDRLLGGAGASARRRGAALAALAVAATALSLLTWQRTHVWRDALTLWDDAIATHPEPSVAYMNRALVRYERGDFDGTIADLTVYLTVNPFHSEAHRVRGGAHMQSGRPREALEDFDLAVGLRPDNAEALNNRGALLATGGELARAIDDFNKALAIKPRYRMALLNRARARETLGDLEGAARDFAQARALEP